jgi:hypothetical protein
MTTHNSDRPHGDVQVTIAELQAQLTASKDIVKKIAQGQDPVRCLTESMSMVLELKQRVAELELDNETWRQLFEANPSALWARLDTLQSSHATLLGLVQALKPLPHFTYRVSDARDEDDLFTVYLDIHGHGYGSCAEFMSREQALAFVALLTYAATLPAQPTEGTSLSITRTIEHDDA